jgi:hypothetical protein
MQPATNHSAQKPTAELLHGIGKLLPFGKLPPSRYFEHVLVSQEILKYLPTSQEVLEYFKYLLG